MFLFVIDVRYDGLVPGGWASVPQYALNLTKSLFEIIER